MKQPEKTGNRILVVDDDPDISMMLKLMLEYKGYSVTIVEKANEAVNKLRESFFNMTIIDMLLSGVSGTDICREIRQEPEISDCPVLMISAHPNAKEICLEAGADDFIAKPFDMSHILTKVNSLISKRK
jgi:DNA-binding response OmpR family regulator